MKSIQTEQYYHLKELQNLMNNFEKVYIILKNNIEKFKINNQQNKYYLAWISGIHFYKKNILIFDKFILDTLFKNISQSLKVKKLSLKSNLFIYFCLGAISALNYSSKKKDYYRDYMDIISKGAVILEELNFDTYKNGVNFWELSTLARYFNNNSKKTVSHNNLIIENNNIQKQRNFIIN